MTILDPRGWTLFTSSSNNSAKTDYREEEKEEQTSNADAIRDDHGPESVSGVLAVDVLAQLVHQVTAGLF